MTQPSDVPEDEEVARVAHAIWEAEGRPEGRADEHWSRARQLIADGRPDLAFANASPEVEPRPDRGQKNPPKRTAEQAPDTPGPRNPEPLPPMTAEGHVEVPSVEQAAGAALSDDPQSPTSRRSRAASRPGARKPAG